MARGRARIFSPSSRSPAPLSKVIGDDTDGMGAAPSSIGDLLPATAGFEPDRELTKQDVYAEGMKGRDLPRSSKKPGMGISEDHSAWAANTECVHPCALLRTSSEGEGDRPAAIDFWTN